MLSRLSSLTLTASTLGLPESQPAWPVRRRAVLQACGRPQVGEQAQLLVAAVAMHLRPLSSGALAALLAARRPRRISSSGHGNPGHFSLDPSVGSRTTVEIGSCTVLASDVMLDACGMQRRKTLIS